MANEEHLNLLKQGVDIWNEKRPDKVDLSYVNLSGATLSVTNPDLIIANLMRVAFQRLFFFKSGASEAFLRGAFLRGIDLSGADLSRTDLSGADLFAANLSGANLRGADLFAANLFRANLTEANLTGANLIGAQLIGANLIGANFRASQALHTNFENANFTATCIEDWNINKGTNLTNVICDYIYLKYEKSEENGKMIFTERRPSNPDENFAPGDFARLVQKTIETVDLIFRDGIEWKSFAVSLQELNQEAKIKIASENDPLFIRAIETRDDGSFVIRVNIPAELDKAEIEKSFKRKYAQALKVREEYYRRELKAKDEQIQLLHREYKIDFKEMFATLAQVQSNKIITYMSNNGDIYHINAPTGIAHSSGEIKGQAKIAGVLNEAQQQNLNIIKVEIDQILQPLLEKYPTKTTSEQMIVASQAIQQIENNPSLKTRLINALKEGSLAALEQSLNHPVCSFIINAVKGWQEAE